MMETDYGSFSDSLMNTKNKNDRAEFYGLSEDIGKLPSTGINSGSTAYCADTGDVYVFIKSTGKWYKQ